MHSNSTVFLVERSKAFYQQGGVRFLLAWKEGTFRGDFTTLLYLCFLQFTAYL